MSVVNGCIRVSVFQIQGIYYKSRCQSYSITNPQSGAIKVHLLTNTSLTMMHYKKGKNVEEELAKDSIPIECLPNDFLWMHVKGGTKVSNVVDYAKKSLDSGEHRAVVWTGSGGGVTKTISCAEILKREYNLHQVTRVCFRKVEEYWDPLLDGLEQIVATRKVPCIHILVSLDEIDSTRSGYQAPKTDTTFWEESKKETRSDASGSIGRRNPNGDQPNRRRKPPRSNRPNVSRDEEKSQKKS